jgi:hypothetical protein
MQATFEPCQRVDTPTLRRIIYADRVEIVAEREDVRCRVILERSELEEIETDMLFCARLPRIEFADAPIVTQGAD